MALIFKVFFVNLLKINYSSPDGFALHSARLSLDHLDLPHPPLCQGDPDPDNDFFYLDDEKDFPQVSSRNSSQVEHEHDGGYDVSSLMLIV